MKINKSIKYLFIVLFTVTIFAQASISFAQSGTGTLGGGGTGGAVGSGGVSFASCPSSIADLSTLVVWIICFIMKALVPLAFSIAIILFIVGVIKYVINADNEAKRKEGGNFILWGVLALFVMLSVWGLVAVLSNTVGQDTAIPQLPIAPTTTY